MIQMKAIVQIKQAQLALKTVQSRMEQGLKAEGDADRTEYEKTTKNWHHRVIFRSAVNLKGDTPSVTTETSDHPYWFVHEGVSVLRAVFSRNWAPKTQPKVLGSGPGSGQMLYVTKKIAKPPYKPRKFTEKIIEIRQKPFQENMQKAIERGIVESQKP